LLDEYATLAAELIAVDDFDPAELAAAGAGGATPPVAPTAKSTPAKKVARRKTSSKKRPSKPKVASGQPGPSP